MLTMRNLGLWLLNQASLFRGLRTRANEQPWWGGDPDMHVGIGKNDGKTISRHYNQGTLSKFGGRGATGMQQGRQKVLTPPEREILRTVSPQILCKVTWQVYLNTGSWVLSPKILDSESWGWAKERGF